MRRRFDGSSGVPTSDMKANSFHSAGHEAPSVSRSSADAGGVASAPRARPPGSTASAARWLRLRLPDHGLPVVVLQRLAHVHHAGLEVEIDPTQATDLAGTETKRRHDTQRGAQTVFAGGSEKPTRLVGREGTSLLRCLRVGGEIGQCRRHVACNVATTLGPTKRLAEYGSESNQRGLHSPALDFASRNASTCSGVSARSR